MAPSLATSTTAFNTATTTSAVPGQITNPAFFGYTSQSIIGGTIVYASENCQAASTFFTSSDYVACCSESCTPFTGCLSASTLVGPSTTSVCSPYSTCKTDIVFPTQGAVGSLAIYCGEGVDVYWYRTLPTDGVDSSNVNSVKAAHTTNSGLGLPVGAGIGGVIFLLLTVGILYCLCCGGCLRCRGTGFSGGSGRHNTNDGYMTEARDREYDRQQRQQEEMYRRQEDDDRRRREQADQDAQARMNANNY